MNLEVETISNEIAEMVVKSLLIDVRTTSDYFDRSNIAITTHEDIIKLRIESKDITAAKASMNTSLKWLENTIEIIEKYYTPKIK